MCYEERMTGVPDSRKIVSGSKDSTLKVWCASTKVSLSLSLSILLSSFLHFTSHSNCNRNFPQKLLFDLPGHEDEVYAVDWSPVGERRFLPHRFIFVVKFNRLGSMSWISFERL